MRAVLFFLSLLLSQHSLAQLKDSVLKPVTVYGVPEEKFLHGSTITLIDSTLKARESSRHLGELLSLQLPIYFRNYGNGMLSSISMRGTSPQHTVVLWNGININSFSLGQADFSILPSFAFSDVKVHAGAGSARFGSGAFGGTILLNSSAIQSQTKLAITEEVGSYGRYFSSARVNWFIGKWNFSSAAYNLESKNNFKILSTNEHQQHASFRQSGFLQAINYKISSAKEVSINYWYHNSDREIQPTIGQVNSQDNQQDRNQRLSINYKSNGKYGFLVANGGYINDAIVFNGSEGIVERWIASARQNFVSVKKIQTQVGAEWNHIIGKIPNYANGKAVEDRFNFLASFQTDLSHRISASLNLSQPVVAGFDAPFLPYLGADFVLIKKEKVSWTINTNISKNYRVPSLNDRYWQNAGDIKLLPETSHAAEVGWNLCFKNFQFSNALFAQRVDNWIQWVPEANGSYQPKNVQQVLAEGFDFKFNGRLKIQNIVIVPMISYQFIRSITTQAPATQQYTINKQLIYTPQHTANGYLQFALKKYSSDISAQYSGRRYTDSGNSETYALPAFILLNASIGKYWTLDQHRLDIRLSVKNILNLDYQLYSGRAMPGRNFNIQINYQLQSKQK
jgi:iron complex outermembrane receptor protein